MLMGEVAVRIFNIPPYSGTTDGFMVDEVIDGGAAFEGEVATGAVVEVGAVLAQLIDSNIKINKPANNTPTKPFRFINLPPLLIVFAFYSKQSTT
jgi:hypothetical protein